jgi:hypothetical protein
VPTDPIYCTIDTSRVEESRKEEAQIGPIRTAIEKEIQESSGQENWRCIAVMRHPRNTNRIRIACRNEEELQEVKKAAEKTGTEGIRVLRDQLFPIKIDSVNRTVVLDENDQIRLGIAEKLGKENNVQIAKMAWLSKKDIPKAYGSMVIYLTKDSDVRRLLQEEYFHIAGESAHTSIFDAFSGPIRCYRCQEIGHKAFNCSAPQICGKCAQEGHHHSDCSNIPKCALCRGPHESFSRNCPNRSRPVAHPQLHE